MATDFKYNSKAVPGGDIAVHNSGASDITAGTLVKIDTAHAPSVTQAIAVSATAANTDLPFGIAIETIPAAGDGRVRVLGSYPVKCAAGCTVGDLLMPSGTAGEVDTQSAGKPQIGFAMNTAAAGDSVEVWIAIAKNA